MRGFLKQFSPAFFTRTAGFAILAIVAIELLAGPWVRNYRSHEVDETLHALQKNNRNHNVVLVGDSVGRGIFEGWKPARGSIAMLACNQATETTGQYFFLKRYLAGNRLPGAVVICDRTPGSGDLNQALTENYVQRCFTWWREIFGLLAVKLDPVFTTKMIAYKMLGTFRNRLHLQRRLAGFTNSDIYSGIAPDTHSVKAGYGIFGLVGDQLQALRGEPASRLYLVRMLEEMEGLGVPVYYLPPPTSQAGKSSHPLVQESLAMLRKLSRRFRGLHVVEEAYVRLPESHFSDEVHLNSTGLAAYRPAVQPYIDNIVREAVQLQERQRATAFGQGRVLFTFVDVNEALAIRPLVGTDITMKGRALQVTSGTGDPAVLLPELAGKGPGSGGRLVLRVEMEGSSSTVARLYYADGKGNFAQQRSLRARVEPGGNSLFFLLPDDFESGRLRFDPGEVAGRYLLHAVEARVVPDGSAIFF